MLRRNVDAQRTEEIRRQTKMLIRNTEAIKSENNIKQFCYPKYQNLFC